MKSVDPERLCGVWSATPTPFDEDMRVDTESVARLVEHHLQLGVKGLFLGGTCGEGPWMPDCERRRLVRAASEAAGDRLVLAVQVTDNSAARILQNSFAAAEDGADLAVIAPPYFLMNATPQNVKRLYLDAIRNNPLPAGIYDRGENAAVSVADESLRASYAEPGVVLVKDSSADGERMRLALEARKKRPSLRLLNGDEFKCVPYLRAGYDGLLLGGGIFNARLAAMIIAAVDTGNITEAERLQARMNRLMLDVYGGPRIECWLAGLKHLLVELGVFRTTCNFLNYTLSESCRLAIAAALEREQDVLRSG